jgi:hypothetical protein
VCPGFYGSTTPQNPWQTKVSGHAGAIQYRRTGVGTACGAVRCLRKQTPGRGLSGRSNLPPAGMLVPCGCCLRNDGLTWRADNTAALYA